MANKTMHHVIIGADTYEIVDQTARQTDATLTQSGKAADAKAVGDALSGTGSGVPSSVRQAMKTLFEKAAYIEEGLADEVAVVQAWASEVTAITISASAISINGATTNQLSAVTTPAGGTVTWESSNTAVATVSNTGLVTGVGNGAAIITARSGDVSATCTATVTGFATLTGIEAVYTQSGTVYDTASLDDLKDDLVVTGTYDDSSTETITDYTLSGTLAEGTSTITVSYGGFTDTFSVTVSPAPLVPSAYQQVAYIKSTGTQRIETNLYVKTKYDTSDADSVAHYSAEVDFKFDEWVSTAATNIFFGFGTEAGNWIGYNNTNGNISMGTASGTYFTTGDPTERHQYTYAYDSSKYGTFTRDDNVSIKRLNDVATASNRNVQLLGYYNTSSNIFYSNGRMYGCKVYKNGTKVLDLVPCYRKSDDEIGMYDVVNDTFYTNAGTGTFEKGSDV